MPRQRQPLSRLGLLDAPYPGPPLGRARCRGLPLDDGQAVDLEPQPFRDLERLPGEGALPGMPPGPQRPDDVLGSGVGDDPPSPFVDVERVHLSPSIPCARQLTTGPPCPRRTRCAPRRRRPRPTPP